MLYVLASLYVLVLVIMLIAHFEYLCSISAIIFRVVVV